MDNFTAEYDMSWSTNARINYYLWKCNQCDEEDNAIMWIKCCNILIKECSHAMKNEEELTEYNDLMKEIEKNYDELQQYENHYSQGQKYEPPRKVYDNLRKLEVKLRKKLDKMDLIMKRAESYDSAMD